jgi:hypothetical protein
MRRMIPCKASAEKRFALSIDTRIVLVFVVGSFPFEGMYLGSPKRTTDRPTGKRVLEAIFRRRSR